MTELLIKGATAVDEQGERRMDVRVEGQTIVEVGPDLDRSSPALELDGSHGYLLPAFVDLHTHLREPGGERAETVESGTRAAVLGGYRAVVAMPNTDPAIDCVEAVVELRRLAKSALCKVIVSSAITVGRRGDELVGFRELAAAGVHLFSDDGRGVQDGRLMKQALEAAKELGVVLAQHCEQETLSRGGHMHEGRWSSALGLAGQPSLAEESMVRRDLSLVRELKAMMHFLHLSTAGSIELVRAAKREGLFVTAEATPHHLSLSDKEVEAFDPCFKVNPPLRPARDVQAVRAGLLDKTIDAIATDHAPHSPEMKDEPFDLAPPGMIGLETAFAVAYTELVAGRHLRVEEEACLTRMEIGDLVRLFSTNPTRIAGLTARSPAAISVGAPADLVLFDPTERWAVTAREGASRSKNTPFSEMELIGRVRHTVVGGEIVVVDGRATR